MPACSSAYAQLRTFNDPLGIPDCRRLFSRSLFLLVLQPDHSGCKSQYIYISLDTLTTFLTDLDERYRNGLG